MTELMSMHPSEDSSIMHAIPEGSRNSFLDPFDGDIAFTEIALNEITCDLVDATETMFVSSFKTPVF